MQIHWESLADETKELFQLVSTLPFISEFYLGGGTGLALQIGHRFSIDLDFFSDSPRAVGEAQRKTILNVLKEESSLKITWDKDGTFVANCKNCGSQNDMILPIILQSSPPNQQSFQRL